MKVFEYTFDTTVDFSGPVREHAFVLRCLPRRGEGVAVLDESLVVEPGVRCTRQRDSFGNELAVGSIRGPHDRIGYHARGTVRIDLHGAPTGQPSEAHPLYRYASPLAACDDEMARWATSLGLDAALAGGAEGALETFHALGHAVNREMSYVSGATSVATSATEAFANRAGVCQDFAHIMIAVLRRAGIPARYVSGLAEGQGTTHAWAQAHIDGAWHGFDPTRDAVVDEAYLPLAVGRDWSDCPIEQGSFWGLVDQVQTVFMTMTERS